MTIALFEILALLIQFGGPGAGLLPMRARSPQAVSAASSHSARCTILPGSVLAVVRVEQDTMLPHGPAGIEPMSASGVAPSPRDSLLAMSGTPMPAARVTLLQTDSATRALLTANGVRDEQPQGYLRAAPYRADCRTIRWLDTIPFVVRGEVGYVRAYLRPAAEWIDGRPLLVIADAWNYPYPRRRAIAFDASAADELAPAEALFDFSARVEMPRPRSSEEFRAQEGVKREVALAWARAHPAAAALEPIRTQVRQLVLAPDWTRASAMPSRLRGSYRVDIEAGDRRATWYFRTHDRPGYLWLGRTAPTTAAVVADPYVPGYRLVGLAAATRDSLLTEVSLGPIPAPLVWLSTTDRPTAPGNEDRRTLAGVLEFRLDAVPESFWAELDAFIPEPTERERLLRARLPIPRNREQPRLPITVRLTEGGGVRADTVLLAGGREVRVSLQRIDTVSVPRGW